jgi:hypothetical protein
MTLHGDVPVKFLLHEDTMKNSSNLPVERPQIHTWTVTVLSNSRFAF